MMENLQLALRQRGIDNPESVVGRHSPEVIERSIAHWDAKGSSVGPGLLVEIIRAGGPTEKPEPPKRKLRCWTCREEFNPLNVKINGRTVANANCTKCSQAAFDAGRWQEVFLHKAAGEEE